MTPNDQYTYQAAPIVTNVNPNVGPIPSGNSVTITGTSFFNVTAVNFGITPATSFIVNSPTSITAIAPAEATGTVDIIITTPLPPSKFVGIVKKNVFLNKTEFLFQAKWKASPSSNVVFYQIYKKGVVVDKILATQPLVFSTSLKTSNSAKNFAITAVNSCGLKSSPVKITIK